MPQGIYSTKTNDTKRSTYDVQGQAMPVHNFIFVIIEEPGKDGFLTRKIYADINDLNLIKKIPDIEGRIRDVNPEKYGLYPAKATSKVTVSRHVLGDTKSKYVSASTIYPAGSPIRDGKIVYIDIAKLKSSGAKIISTEEIYSALDEHILKYPHTAEKVAHVKSQFVTVDKEVLIDHAKTPAKHIYTPEYLEFIKKGAKVGRVVQGFSIAFTAYDISSAASEAIKVESVKPLAAEAVRQFGGWGGAAAGFKIGAASGAFFGAATGPGAFVTGLVGGIVLGAAGYFGADWVADMIYEN